MKLRLPRLSFSKPDQRGFGHVELIIAIVFIALIAVIGVKVFAATHADPLLTSSQCQLRGRVWSGNGCTKTCLSGAGSHVVADPYDYCSNALSKISSTTCAANGRKYLNVGCARRWQQNNATGAIQCLNSANTYYVQDPYDVCKSTATYTFSCTKSFSPTSPVRGKTFSVSYTIKNTSSKNSGAYTVVFFPASANGSQYNGKSYSSLVAGASRSGSMSISIPSTISGSSTNQVQFGISGLATDSQAANCSRSFYF